MRELRQHRKHERWKRAVSGTPTLAVDIVSKMTREQRASYHLEGGLPPVALPSISDEDYDPTPVPTGCPGCYKRDGSWVCVTCPNAQQANADRRQMIRQGLISPVC